MYCEWICCFPCAFIMKTCEECYKALCCNNKIHCNTQTQQQSPNSRASKSHY